jgi:DNA-binding FadR family transcriptional regulator
MPIQSIEPRRLYRQIADQIRALIRSGEFQVGARLPPERDLARQLGVSRPSVREALIALEVEGLVEVRIGSGIYVLDGGPRANGGDEEQAASGPFELLRARWVIEGECAALARSQPEAHVAAIEEALELMRSRWGPKATAQRGPAVPSAHCRGNRQWGAGAWSGCCGKNARVRCTSSSSTTTTRRSCGGGAR